MRNVENCAGVLQSFPLNSEEFSIKRLCVDVVTDRGNKWIKVIARNPKALSQLSSGKPLSQVLFFFSVES